MKETHIQRQGGVDRVIAIWFWSGVVMVLLQIAIGGITRLTGSGLSITKWEIVVGTLPPLTAEAWQQEFDLYKATPQYEKINRGMSMSDFKFIYFWEYFHRLWARLIAVVFFIPFVIFLLQRRLKKELIKKLLMAFLFGLIVGLFGWIMVKSGLVHRPWVSAYKLSVHLGLAVLLWAYLLYIATVYAFPRAIGESIAARASRSTLFWLLVALFVQLLLGGLMSGMKAGLIYPTWPDYSGSWIPGVIFSSDRWTLDAFMNYDQDIFVPALVQVCHRTWAYLLWAYIGYRWWRSRDRYWGIGFIIVNTQLVLGIWTLVNCVGQIPLWLGITHQLIGILTFGYFVGLYSLVREANINRTSY